MPLGGGTEAWTKATEEEAGSLGNKRELDYFGFIREPPGGVPESLGVEVGVAGATWAGERNRPQKILATSSDSLMAWQTTLHQNCPSVQN